MIIITEFRLEKEIQLISSDLSNLFSVTFWQEVCDDIQNDFSSSFQVYRISPQTSDNIYGGKYSPSGSMPAPKLLPRPATGEEGVRRKPAPPLRDENTVLRHRPALNQLNGSGDIYRHHHHNHHNHVTFDEQQDRVSLQSSSTPTNSLPPPHHPMQHSLHNRLSMLGENLSEEDSSSGGFRIKPTHPGHPDSAAGCRTCMVATRRARDPIQ